MPGKKLVLFSPTAMLGYFGETGRGRSVGERYAGTVAAITGRNNVEVPDRRRTHICEMRSAFSDPALGPDQGVRGTRLIDGKLSSAPVLRGELGQTSMTEPALPPGVRIRAACGS